MAIQEGQEQEVMQLKMGQKISQEQKKEKKPKVKKELRMAMIKNQKKKKIRAQ